MYNYDLFLRPDESITLVFVCFLTCCEIKSFSTRSKPVKHPANITKTDITEKTTTVKLCKNLRNLFIIDETRWFN